MIGPSDPLIVLRAALPGHEFMSPFKLALCSIGPILVPPFGAIAGRETREPYLAPVKRRVFSLVGGSYHKPPGLSFDSFTVVAFVSGCGLPRTHGGRQRTSNTVLEYCAELYMARWDKPSVVMHMNQINQVHFYPDVYNGPYWIDPF